MNFTANQTKSRKLYNDLIAESWKDNVFKQDLISDPVRTMEKFFGESVEIETGKQIIVEDQSNENIVYFNVPSQPDLNELELTDEQLEMVAGGISPTVVPLTICFTVGVVIGCVGEMRSHN